MKFTNKNKIAEIFLVLGIFTILFCSIVSAIGYSTPYDENHPLNVYPGETKNIQIRVKSSPDEGDLIIKANLIENAGIAELTDSSTEYSISPGLEGDGIVNVRLKVPSDAVIGGEYIIKIEFSDITPSKGGGGTANIKTGSTATLKALVVEKPVTETPQEEGIGTGWWILGIVVIIVIIIIIYYIIKSRKK